MKKGHIPLRLCISCRAKKPQKALIRFGCVDRALIRTKTGRYTGRGCYTCPDPKCIEQALKKGKFARALRCNMVVLPPKEALLNGLETEGIINDDVDG